MGNIKGANVILHGQNGPINCLNTIGKFERDIVWIISKLTLDDRRIAEGIFWGVIPHGSQ